ncbi:MAG: uroporphyrinogen decarboxylase family protein [Candidatus Firestonebacteria bacterium]
MIELTKKELYLKALRNQEFEALTWAPNFDWWYRVNKKNNTIPEKYQGLSNNDLIKKVGGTIWRRVEIIKESYDKSVKIITTTKNKGDLQEVKYITPVGEVSTVYSKAHDASETETMFLSQHLIKKVEDIKVVKYMVECTHYELDLSSYYKEIQDVKEDGIVLTCLSCVPYIQVMKTDIGYENAFYFLADYPDEMNDLINTYHKKFLESYKLASNSPVEIISNGDNMDYLTCPPDYFKKYAIPYYQDVKNILHEKGKLAQGHWCGRTSKLMELTGDCGLDIVEAITPKPMTDSDIVESLEILQGKVVIQGGIPSVLMCNQGGTQQDLINHIENLLGKIGKRKGFILGMGDNVPADADFERVAIVSDLVKKFNKEVYNFV